MSIHDVAEMTVNLMVIAMALATSVLFIAFTIPVIYCVIHFLKDDPLGILKRREQ